MASSLDLGTLKIKIGVDTNEANKELNNTQSGISKFASAAGSALKTMGTVATTAIAAASTAIAGLTKVALDNYAEYEQLVGGVETLFADSADTVMNYAANAYKTAGLSANDYMETVTSFSASLLQSLGNDTEAAAQYADMAITDMSDNANKMGSSMESIQNAYQGFAKQNFTMLDNLKLGYGGTKEEMERLLEKAEEIQAANGEMVDYSIDSYADIVEAIHVVQTEMGITGTTAKEASETIQGSVAATKAAWTNLLTGIADDSADLDTLINNFVESAATAANNILPRIEVILTGLGTLIEKMAPILANAIPQLITNVLPTLISAAYNLIVSFTNALTESLPVLAESVPMIVNTIVDTITTCLPMLIDIAVVILETLVSSLIENLPQIIDATIEILTTLINTISEHLPEIVDAALQIIMALVQGIVDNLPEIIACIINLMVTILQTILEKLPEVVQKGNEILNSIVEGIGAVIGNLTAKIVEVVENIKTTITNKLSEIKEKGKEILSNVISGISDKISELKSKIEECITNIKTTITNKLSEIREKGKEICTNIVNGIGDKISSITNKGTEVVNALKNALSAGLAAIRSVGSNLITGLWNGINDKVSWIIGKIRSFGSSVMSAIKGIFGIASPSKEMKKIGDYLVQGLGIGIEENTDIATTATKLLSDQIEKAFNPNLSIGSIDTSAYSLGNHSATMVAKQTATRYNNTIPRESNNNIVQNNYFTSKEMSSYEQQVQIKRLERDLVGGFK